MVDGALCSLSDLPYDCLFDVLDHCGPVERCVFPLIGGQFAPLVSRLSPTCSFTPEKFLIECAKHRYLNLMRWFTSEIGYDGRLELIASAVFHHGTRAMLLWFLDEFTHSKWIISDDDFADLGENDNCEIILPELTERALEQSVSLRGSYWFTRCAFAACLRGSIAAMKAIMFESFRIQARDLKKFTQISAYAAKGGHVELLQWLDERDFPMELFILRDAVLNRHRSVIEWAETKGLFVRDADATPLAAVLGDVGLLKYLKSKGCTWTPETLSSAAESGSIDTVRYLFEDGAPWRTLPLLQSAARSGNVALMELVQSKVGGHFSASALVSAAASKNPAMVEWILARGNVTDWHDIALRYVASTGSLAQLHALFDAQKLREPQVMRFAIQSNNVSNIEWLLSARVPLEPSYGAYLVRHSNFTLLRRIDDLQLYATCLCEGVAQLSVGQLQWLKDHGAAVTKETLFGAIISTKSLAVLDWLIQHGAELHPALWLAALRRGCMPILRWLAERNCPVDHKNYVGPMTKFLQRGGKHVSEWCREHLPGPL